MSRLGVATGVLGLCCVWLAPAAGQQAEAWKARLVGEPSAKWKEYQLLSRRLQGKMTARITVCELGKIIDEMKWEKEFKQNGTSVVTVNEFRGESKGKTRYFNEVIASNSKYAFKLNRKDPNRDWVLAGFDLNSEKILTQRPIPLRKLVLEEIGPQFLFTTPFSQVPLPELLKKPGFITKVTETDRDGRTFLRVEFKHSEKIFKATYLTPGWMLLDPEHFWYPLEYELQYAEREGMFSSVRCVTEVTIGAEGLPIPNRFTHKHAVNKPRAKLFVYREVVYDYDLREVPDLQDDEFTLSAFGLREPAGLPRQRAPRSYLWFAAAAVAALGLALTFRYLVRRRKVAQGAN